MEKTLSPTWLDILPGISSLSLSLFLSLSFSLSLSLSRGLNTYT